MNNLDFYKMLMGMMIARREKTKYQNLDIDVKNNFETEQGLFFGMFKDSVLPMLFLQRQTDKLSDEVAINLQKSKKVASDNQEKIEEKEEEFGGVAKKINQIITEKNLGDYFAEVRDSFPTRFKDYFVLPPTEKPSASKVTYRNDLKVISHIGKKTEKEINANGIYTFEDLKDVSVADLKTILASAENPKEDEASNMIKRAKAIYEFIKSNQEKPE